MIDDETKQKLLQEIALLKEKLVLAYLYTQDAIHETVAI